MKVSENKPHSIHLRLTSEQYDFCKEYADTLGVGVSDFIRMSINSMLVTNSKLQNVTLGDLGRYENNQDNQ